MISYIIERINSVRPAEVTAEETTAFEKYCTELMSKEIRPGAIIWGLCVVVWWPLDLFFLSPQEFAFMSEWRIAALLAIALLVLKTPFKALASRYPARTTVFLTAITLFVIGHSLGKLGGSEHGWFQFLLGSPIFCLSYHGALRWRIAVVSLFATSGTAGLLLAKPDDIFHSHFPCH